MIGDLFEQAGIQTAAQSKAEQKPPGGNPAKKTKPREAAQKAAKKTANKKPLRKAVPTGSPACAAPSLLKGQRQKFLLGQALPEFGVPALAPLQFSDPVEGHFRLEESAQGLLEQALRVCEIQVHSGLLSAPVRDLRRQ